MTDPVHITTSAIVALAASKFVEAAVEQAGSVVTPLALKKAGAQVSQMWELIKQHFVGSKRAETAIAQVETEQSVAALKKLEVYLDDELSDPQNQALDQKLRQIAQQVISTGQQIQTQQQTTFGIRAQDQSRANAVGELSANNVSFGDSQSGSNLELAFLAAAELYLIRDLIKNRLQNSSDNNVNDKNNAQETHVNHLDNSAESDNLQEAHKNHLDSSPESDNSKVTLNYVSTIAFNYEISDQDNYANQVETGVEDGNPGARTSHGTTVDFSNQSIKDSFDKPHQYQETYPSFSEDGNFESSYDSIDFDDNLFT